MSGEVRLLMSDDAPAYVALRQEMLVAHPYAFASAPGDDRVTERFTRESLAGEGNSIAAGFVDGELVASAGVVRDRHAKLAHCARIWGVYVRERHRGVGLGEAVVGLAIETARRWEGVEAVGLSVSANALEALRLYERLGFVAWGFEPDALRTGGRSYDETHMRLVLG